MGSLTNSGFTEAFFDLNFDGISKEKSEILNGQFWVEKFLSLETKKGKTSAQCNFPIGHKTVGGL